MLNISKLSEITHLFRKATKSQRLSVVAANYSKKVDSKSDDYVYAEGDETKIDLNELFSDDVDEEQRKAEIARIRDKSRLRLQQKFFLDEKPLGEHYQWDKTLMYSRKQYARYGAASGVDPRLCFRTAEERADQEEYLRVAHPLTMNQMLEANRKIRQEKQAKIQAREEKIATNMGKLNKWMDDLNNRIAKKEQEALAAKEKRDRLMEEVRQHFGFKIDMRDPRFKEMIEKKELEEKKAKKAEKKKQREDLVMQRLREQAASTGEAPKSLARPEQTVQQDDADEKEEIEKVEEKSKKSTKADDKKGDDSDSDNEDNDKKKKKKK